MRAFLPIVQATLDDTHFAVLRHPPSNISSTTMKGSPKKADLYR